MKKITLLALLLCAWVFPNDILAQNSEDEIHQPQDYLSNTLPVMYVTTDSLKPIVSKEIYLTGTYYLDPMGVEGVDSIGSIDNQLALQIRGRGNASWTLAKKPYRIKLGKKASFFGMAKSKHFALMAHFTDWRGYLKEESGYEVSRRMKLAFTPEQHPIELVINGDYKGIYFITQNIRVDKDRVNITEQEDGDTIPENITGGWLIEKDNYVDTPQFDLPRSNKFYITIHSPEVVSDQQMNYIKNFVYAADSLLFVKNKMSREWENYIDIDALARFYIVQEVVQNTEAFSGSMFMHKERGDSTKLIFGPVWDFGSVTGHPATKNYKKLWMFEDVPDYAENVWIEEMLKFPHFQRVIREVWTKEYSDLSKGLGEYLQAWANKNIQAGFADHNRWSDSSGHDIRYQSSKYVGIINYRLWWLNEMWNLNKLYDINCDGSVDIVDINLVVGLILGTITDPPTRKSADVNFDGSVDIVDINAIINHILGKQ